MRRILLNILDPKVVRSRIMANLPPRKISTSNKTKQDASPLQILLQMGFPRHRALKALAATGNRSVQLASDWLLTHVNDAFIDSDEPREYIFYASPTGPLLAQLLEFWDKSKTTTGWNGAHNFPPHITLVSFFKAPDDTSLQLAKAVKHVVENVGDPPSSPLKLEPYISHNFMGLFVSEEHADYLKKIAIQYVKQVSSALGVTVDTYEHLDALGTCFPWCTMQQEKPIKSISLEPHVKSLHITLAYHFDVSAYDTLKALVDELHPAESSWELRLYSRDPRFSNHQVHKVTVGYSPKANDELELVLGDYVYIEEKEIESSPDGWVHGTSWLTGVSGFLPAVCTSRTAESDAWTLHRAISLGNNNSGDCKSESDSNTEIEMSGGYPHDDAHELASDTSEETYKEWQKYWTAVQTDKTDGMLSVTQGLPINWDAPYGNGDTSNNTTGKKSPRRWFFAMRHGERVDLTYGHWVQHSFDEQGNYVRKDLNLPLKLGERAGGKDSYMKDSPLTRLGRFQAQLVGEGLRLAGVSVKHVYASASLRCVETAHSFLEGLQADPSVKIKVEPGLFEFKLWHSAKGMAPFMTPLELYKSGYNVDMKGGNVIFVGHASTLDITVIALKNSDIPEADRAPYQISKNLLRVPYCAFGALKDKPLEVVPPPCPPSINSSSGRFDWRQLQNL